MQSIQISGTIVRGTRVIVMLVIGFLAGALFMAFFPATSAIVSPKAGEVIYVCDGNRWIITSAYVHVTLDDGREAELGGERVLGPSTYKDARGVRLDVATDTFSYTDEFGSTWTHCAMPPPADEQE